MRVKGSSRPARNLILFNAIGAGRAPVRKPPEEPAPLTVLLVEDDAISQMIVEALLTGRGMTVHLAGNGQEALDRLAQGGIDAVLMVCEMPVLDGFEATERLRADPLMQAIPVIAMSAHTAEPELQRCRDAGMNGHVSKPIEPDDLFAALERCVGSR